MGLKSAWEISQEKASALDGRGEAEITLSEEQKTRIAEARKECEAKIAEREVMLQQKLFGCGPDEARQLREEFKREKMVLENKRDEKIEEIRKQKT